MKNAAYSCIFSLIIIFCCISNIYASGSLLVRNARLIDCKEFKVQEGISILIQNGRIEKIGKDISAKEIYQLDVKGSYVLPGIIDSHVHLAWGPGAALNNYLRSKEWESAMGKHILQYLRAYLACGVTTVLDAGSGAYIIEKIRGHLSNGRPGPRFLSLGEFFAPPNGYGSNPANPPVSSREEVEAKLDRMTGLKVIGVKVPIEKGWVPNKILPLHSRDTLEAIRLGAARRRLPVYIHATTVEAFNAALDMGAYALMHSLTNRGEEQLSKTFIERMAHASTHQVSTMSIMDSELALHKPDRLNDPLLALTVPQSELLTARDPNSTRESHIMMMMDGFPEIHKNDAALIADLMISEYGINISLRNCQKGIYDLHKAGVKIVMGSDTVFHPYTVYSFHGFTSLREIELLGESGLSPAESIKAATVNGAQMAGLDREIGTVEAGKCADLVVLKDNPLNDLKAFRTVRWTIKDGIAKTPKEWMSQ